MSSGEAFPLYS